MKVLTWPVVVSRTYTPRQYSTALVVTAPRRNNFWRVIDIHGDLIFKNVDIGLLEDPGHQNILHLLAGHIVGMNDPAAGMAAFRVRSKWLAASPD